MRQTELMAVGLSGVLAVALLTGGLVASGTQAVPEPGHGSAGPFTVAFTGDTLIHVPIATRASNGAGKYDFRPMFAPVRQIISGADLAICHLEVPLSPDNRVSGYPNFSSPGDLAAALAYAGYDGCSTASNHSYDRGAQGVIDTVQILERAGLAQAGMATEVASGWDATYYSMGDLTLAHISATYWLNGYVLPEDQPWLVQAMNIDQILAIAARAKLSGADLVVVSLHCCIEYLREPTAVQAAMHRELIRSPDVDLVVAHHSHVVGPVEQLDGEFILHGLGNLLSAQRGNGKDDGVVAIATAEKSEGLWSFSAVEVVPTWVERGTYRILPAILENRPSYLRTMEVLHLYGAEVPHAIWPGFPGYRLPQV